MLHSVWRKGGEKVVAFVAMKLKVNSKLPPVQELVNHLTLMVLLKVHLTHLALSVERFTVFVVEYLKNLTLDCKKQLNLHYKTQMIKS